MKKPNNKQTKSPTYTMVIHDLAEDFSLNSNENIVMCTMASMENANVNGEARLNYKHLMKATQMGVDGLKKLVKRLVDNGLLIRTGKGLYKTASQFRRAYNKYRFQIQEDNGFKTNMKVLKEARENERKAV